MLFQKLMRTFNGINETNINEYIDVMLPSMAMSFEAGMNQNLSMWAASLVKQTVAASEFVRANSYATYLLQGGPITRRVAGLLDEVLCAEVQPASKESEEAAKNMAAPLIKALFGVEAVT